MKTVKLLSKISAIIIVMIVIHSCEDIRDIDKIDEKLELSSSSFEIKLDDDKIEEDIITFTWSEARTLSDDYLISYVTKLDVLGNNFGASTAIITYEDEGIFSKSYTSEQINNWITEKWNLPPNKTFTLEFRVFAQWEGGPNFHSPEVRTVNVEVQPIKTIVFDADKIFVEGSAISGLNDRIEISKTLENDNQYAGLINLTKGELIIPVEFQNEFNYICPADGEGSLIDGEAETVKMRDKPISWKIETPGEYRIVVNMEKAIVSIYSPDKALQPAIVEWIIPSTGEKRTTIVNELWLFGGGTGWSWWKGNCTVSLADPQILIYQGEPIKESDGVKFVVYGESDHRNVAYCYSSPLDDSENRQNNKLELNKVSPLSGDFSGEQRNSFYIIPSGTNFIVLNLRDKTIRASKI